MKIVRGKLVAETKCHPNRKHYALGLCAFCYSNKKYVDNKETTLLYQRNRQIEYPETYYFARMKKQYGLSYYEHEILMLTHGGGCSICGDTMDWSLNSINVDHSHQTGKVRGLLCPRHNHALADVRDNESELKSLIDYLRESE